MSNNEVMSVVSATPVQLETFEVPELKNALMFLTERLHRSNLNERDRKLYEEQYCYVFRELELRKSV